MHTRQQVYDDDVQQVNESSQSSSRNDKALDVQQHNNNENVGEQQTRTPVSECAASAQSNGGQQLDEANERIRQLQDELKKVNADRQHWRTLAIQV